MSGGQLFRVFGSYESIYLVIGCYLFAFPLFCIKRRKTTSTEVRIYKRKRELDQESDQENKKKERKQELEQESDKEKKKKNSFFS